MMRNSRTDTVLGTINFGLPSDSVWAKTVERSAKLELEGDQRLLFSVSMATPAKLEGLYKGKYPVE